MLDLTKLARQMQGIGEHLSQEAVAGRQRLERAAQYWQEAQSQQEEIVEKQHRWRDRLIFTAAEPLEPLDTHILISPPPDLHTIIATDGSQIAPNHHEIAYCYLINIGQVMLHYGQSLHPLLDSLPEVFYRSEDLYVSRQWGIRTEEWLGYRRTVSEAEVLAELACSWIEQRKNQEVPTLAMVDGSLIYWFLEQLPGDAKDLIVPPILQAWTKLQEAKIPLVGYLSASRSIESLNFLRFPACPHPVPDCFSYCAALPDKAPCQVFEPLRDTNLWALQLEPGERGTLWKSSAKILDLYGEHQVYFCYLHVGTEIARIEIPAWVAEDAQQLDLVLGLVLAQVHKGYGYPVALAEAHNQAVVRGGDRARFFSLLEQQMIKAGLQNVGISYKETRKRGSIA